MTMFYIQVPSHTGKTNKNIDNQHNEDMPL